jgi:uncharacterized protein (DUF885 family)
LAVVVLAAGCSGSHESQDAAFAAAVTEHLQQAFRQQPVWATEMGMHEHDGDLDDLSAEAVQERAEWLVSERRRFRGFAAGRLSRDNRVDRDILLQELESQLFELHELRDWQHNPLLYTQLAGNSIHLLLARDFAPRDVRLAAAESRLRQIPRLLQQAQENLENPPRVHTEVAMRQCGGVVQLVQGDLLRAAAGSPRAAALARAADSAVAAIDEYEDFLAADLLPRSEGEFRLGRRRFDRKLRHTLQSGLTSDDVRRRAEAELERVPRQMFALAAPLYRAMFPDSTPPRPDPDARRDAVVQAVLDRIASDHPMPYELLGACRAAVDSLSRFVMQHDVLGLDPRQRLAIEWTPEFARGVNVAGLDAPGPLERNLRSFYHVQPIPPDWTQEQAASYLREYNHAMIQVLSMHEAVPGHFVQLYWSNRCPSLVRSVFPNGAFVEGWAVYSERLMIESGYGGGDPRLELQQLKFYLRTVLNALVDIGVHCDDMGEAEVARLLTGRGFQEESEARSKWVRAQLSSTQLCSYFVGLQEILDLEAADRERRGLAWSRRDFCERLLSHGSPPVRHLRALVLDAGGPRAEPALEAAP